jgi:hypothetical protein
LTLTNCRREGIDTVHLPAGDVFSNAGIITNWNAEDWNPRRMGQEAPAEQQPNETIKHPAIDAYRAATGLTLTPFWTHKTKTLTTNIYYPLP